MTTTTTTSIVSNSMSMPPRHIRSQASDVIAMDLIFDETNKGKSKGPNLCLFYGNNLGGSSPRPWPSFNDGLEQQRSQYIGSLGGSVPGHVGVVFMAMRLPRRLIIEKPEKVCTFYNEKNSCIM